MLGRFKRFIFNMRVRIKYGRADGIMIAKQRRNFEQAELAFDSGSSVKIEEGLIFKKNITLRCRKGAKLSIGKNAYFNNNCVLVCRGKIAIGDDVSFGPNVCIFDHDHDYRSDDRRHTFISGEISIGDNAWIGASAVILRGARIGKNSVIAAGAVVNCDVPDDTVFYCKGKTKKIR